MNLRCLESLIKVQGAAQNKEGAANLKPWSSMNQDFRTHKSLAESQGGVLEMWYFAGDIFYFSWKRSGTPDFRERKYGQKSCLVDIRY